MIKLTSGRHSRYPAVNRGPIEAPTPVAAVPEPEVVSEPAIEVTPEPESSEEILDVSTMTIDEIVAWVGDDSDRREEAIWKEKKGKERKTLLARLRLGD